MKKILKIIFLPILCLVFAAGCSQILPFIPSIIDDEGENSEQTKKVCGLITESSSTGMMEIETTSRLSASISSLSQTSIKIAACYSLKGNEVDAQTSGFIFDKVEKENNTYTYYVATSSSGIFYRYITSGGSNFSVENNTEVLRDGVFEFTLNDGYKFSGNLVGYFDPYDVAVFSFESKRDYDVVEFGDSDLLRVGETIYAYGTPLRGYNLYNTLVKGYVSGLNRMSTIGFENTYGSTTYSGKVTTYPTFQIDAAINPGMEGGPVFNTEGYLVGMLGYRYESSSEYESTGFVANINDLKNILNDILNKGSFTKPLLGVMVTDISNVLTNSNCAWLIEHNVYKGVYITYGDGISDDGAAKKAKMVPDCVIVSVENDGHVYQMENLSSLYSCLVRIDPSKPVIVNVILNDGTNSSYTLSL